MKKYLAIVPIILISCTSPEVSIIPVSDNVNMSSMRGLYAVNEQIVWASGADGVIMKTVNNRDWTSYIDTSLAHLDFRDIHAFNENEAIIMSSGDGCEIYRTNDGGKSWMMVYENSQEGIFFDGMDFWDNKSGIAFSDPIDGKIFLIESHDGGRTWQQLVPNYIPGVLEGEAGFAASGTGINCVGENTVFIGTGGGNVSRVFKSSDRGKNWEAYNTPLRAGEASGIYTMSMKSELIGVITGGNYLDSANTENVCAYTVDGGVTWKISEQAPSGYRSCIAYSNDEFFVACGRNGIDISSDLGKTWKKISNDAYYSCVITNGSGWLTGRNGKMAKIEIK